MKNIKKMNLKELINNPNTSIIDVRTIGEYEEAHLKNTLNIPLHEVPDHIEKFKNMSKPLIFCCNSGNRSNQAIEFLKDNGIIEIYNGGSWNKVAELKE